MPSREGSLGFGQHPWSAAHRLNPSTNEGMRLAEQQRPRSIGYRIERRTTARNTSAARSSGRTELNAPPCLPIGVRTASMIQASVAISFSFI
jgi:hypothetical protein